MNSGVAERCGSASGTDAVAERYASASATASVAERRGSASGTDLLADGRCRVRQRLPSARPGEPRLQHGFYEVEITTAGGKHLLRCLIAMLDEQSPEDRQVFSW
jgi:hypothetical protein